jgi:hypothetical protein
LGKDNQIDGVVLDVLLRKHKQIKSDLGVSVAVPGSSEDVVEALFEGMLLRGGEDAQPGLFDDWLKPQKEDLHAKWDDAREKEKRSRSRFAQRTIDTKEVAAELEAVREAVGVGPATRAFVTDVLQLVGVPLTAKSGDRVVVNVGSETPRALRHAIGRDDPFTARFDLPVNDGEVYLSRTHPITEAIASWVLETALDDVEAADERFVARRCGVTCTAAVSARTSLLLVRFRYHLITRTASGERTLLAEEIRPLAFRGTPGDPAWLSDAEADALLAAQPSGNVLSSMVQQQLQSLIDRLGSLEPALGQIARQQAGKLLEAHLRVREAAKLKGPSRVEPILPTDLLGCFVLLPNA